MIARDLTESDWSAFMNESSESDARRDCAEADLLILALALDVLAELLQEGKYDERTH